MERYFACFFAVVGVLCPELSTSDSPSLLLLLSLEADVEVLALLKYELRSIVLKSKILCILEKRFDPLYTLPDVK